MPRVYIDGSFVSRKPHPGDIDGCWEVDHNVVYDRIDPVLLDFKDGRKQMKRKHGVDFFVAAHTEAGSGLSFLDFFQHDRDGRPKGILVVNLRS